MSINHNRWILLLFVEAACIFGIVTLLFDSNRPDYYQSLFMLPLIFGILSLIFNRIYECVPRNLGCSIIMGLLFVRLVVDPICSSLAGYRETISLNVQNNTPYAVYLMCYEAVMVFITLFCLSNKYDLDEEIKSPHYYANIGTGYKTAVIILICIALLCYYITPGVMEGFRSITHINDDYFSNFENGRIIAKYGNSFTKKLSMVTGNYIIKILVILLPTITIIQCGKMNNLKIAKVISFFICLTPFFFIDGAIARSVIYATALFMLRNYTFSLYNSESRNTKKMILIMSAAIAAVVLYWANRYSQSDSNNLLEYISAKVSTYFSGVNIITGSFNLPRSFDYRLRYFVYDFTETVPFGNTIFRISHETIQPFFNQANHTYGQIPTTIGMGYYYFGVVFSPLYSIIFTVISFKASLRLKKESNLLSKTRLILTAFYFSMGIVMYNIEITMINSFCIIIPLYILEKLNTNGGISDDGKQHLNK